MNTKLSFSVVICFIAASCNKRRFNAANPESSTTLTFPISPLEVEVRGKRQCGDNEKTMNTKNLDFWVYHWTSSADVLRDPRNFIAKKLLFTKQPNAKDLHNNGQGNGFFVAGDPLQSLGKFGTILMAIKLNQNVVMHAAQSEGDPTPLFAETQCPASLYHFTPGWKSTMALAIYDLSVIDLDSIVVSTPDLTKKYAGMEIKDLVTNATDYKSVPEAIKDFENFRLITGLAIEANALKWKRLMSKVGLGSSGVEIDWGMRSFIDRNDNVTNYLSSFIQSSAATASQICQPSKTAVIGVAGEKIPNVPADYMSCLKNSMSNLQRFVILDRKDFQDMKNRDGMPTNEEKLLFLNVLKAAELIDGSEKSTDIVYLTLKASQRYQGKEPKLTAEIVNIAKNFEKIFSPTIDELVPIAERVWDRVINWNRFLQR